MGYLLSNKIYFPNFLDKCLNCSLIGHRFTWITYCRIKFIGKFFFNFLLIDYQLHGLPIAEQNPFSKFPRQVFELFVKPISDFQGLTIVE